MVREQEQNGISGQLAMTGQVVIAEKSSQARDVRAAVGSRYGAVLAAEGHLLDLQEPEDAEPAWKRWSPVLLRPGNLPGGLYGTRPATGGNKAAKLAALRDALRGAGGCYAPAGVDLDPFRDRDWL
jgi:DNA topoisomerase III